MTLPTLTHDQCRFMRPEHVDRYNRFVALLDRCREPLAGQSQTANVVALEERLRKLVPRMTRNRFRIGFIGPSQVGKSFTVSNFLGVPREQSPTPEGKGEAMTSAPTRIRRSGGIQEGAPGAIQLHYMLKDEFRARVANICSHPDMVYLEITPHHDPSRTLEAVKLVKDRVKPGDLDTYHYLVRVLQSGIRFESLLAETENQRRTVEGNYNDRRSYVTDENPSSAENQYLLLREATIDFVSEILPPDLEIIDLPGMGTIRKSDDEVTRSFLPELDGAFIFQKCHQLKEGAIGTLLNAMYVEHKANLQGRIWYVVTFLDKLEPTQVRAGEETILDLIAKRIKLFNLPAESNVLLIGNGFYQEIVAKGPEGRKRPPHETEHGWKTGVDGTPEPIEAMLRPPELSRLYREVLKDGGIPMLREVATSRVRSSVQAAEQAAVEKELEEIKSALTTHLEQAAARSGMPLEAIIACVEWEAQLQVVRTQRLRKEFGHVEAPVRQLQAAIETTADRLLPTGFSVKASEMSAKHEQVTQALAHVAADTAQAAVESAFTGVEKMVREIKAAPIKDGPIPDPAEECLRGLSARAKESEWITEVFRRFRDEYPGIASLERIEVYRSVLRRKIAAIVRELAGRIIHEAGAVLAGIEQRLKDLGGNSSTIHRDQRELLQQLAGEARGL